MIAPGWEALAAGDPALAAFGQERLHGRVAYLATVRRDGSPRVHPVTPIVGEGRLFVFMEPTSPKGRELRLDGRYAMHSAVDDTSGSNGEFFIAGRAAFIEDPETRQQAARLCSYTPADRYVLFELSVESAASTIYNEGPPERRRWQA